MTAAIEIYQSEGLEIEVRLDAKQETLWLSQKQIAELFGKDLRTVNEHLKNIYSQQELTKQATIRKFRIVQHECAREVKRQIEHYNLDAIISVGYRVNSLKGTQFRIWATKTLREHLVQGYTLNQQRFEQNSKTLQQALALIQKTAQSPELTSEAGSGLVDGEITLRRAQGERNTKPLMLSLSKHQTMVSM